MDIPEPIVEDIAGTDQVRLMADYELALPTLDKRCIISQGFVYDGASIPRFAWPLVGHPLEYDNLPAATAHDALYDTQLVSREDADNVLYERLRAAGKTWLAAQTMYWAVRMAGGALWARHTPDSIAAARKMVTLA
jgi:hypothetical protein